MSYDNIKMFHTVMFQTSSKIFQTFQQIIKTVNVTDMCLISLEIFYVKRESSYRIKSDIISKLALKNEVLNSKSYLAKGKRILYQPIVKACDLTFCR